MTNHWVDIKNADIVLIMGGNAAEAHPCGFKWVTEAKAHNKARLIVVDPRFTRSASVADLYVPIRTGTDIAFLGGVISYLLSEDKIQHEYVRNYTDLSFIVREDFAFADGLYSGYNPAKRSYDKSTWDYEYGPDGYVKADPALAHPRCVYQLLKTHYARYTPEMVERVCGTPKDKFLKVCEMIGSTSTPTRAMTIMYALGWTQHSVGSQMAYMMVMARVGVEVRPRLDAALGRLADDSLRRDDAAAAGQHRCGRRRHERAARAFQHPGAHGPGAHVEPAAGVYHAAGGEGAVV